MSDCLETVLQFGTGRFLRAFVDRFLQHAHDAGQDVGQVVVVQSTTGQRAELLRTHPDGYHVLVRGIENGQLVERTERVHSISRALLAAEQWPDVLNVARSRSLRQIVSNATEAGYVLDDKDRLDSSPPSTLPGKLTQVLYARYQSGGGPLTILPCELIERNASKLLELVLTQSQRWSLPAPFQQWCQNECVWLNNLVDCIVTRGPEEHPLAKEDPLLICAEPYCLWAIEKPAGKMPDLWKHPAIQLVDELGPYYFRKVRILNGTHTAMAAKFLPAGFVTVQQVLADKAANRWIRGLIFEEIVPTIAYRVEDVAQFADDTYDRLRNPFLNHRLSDIALNHVDKVRVRLLPTREEYEKLFGKSPRRIAEAMTWTPG